jgi:general secretion pathway protein B
MSILLDAVTREKQQQMGALPDAVLTPRVSYPKPSYNGRVLFITGALLATVGAAWVMVQVMINVSAASAALGQEPSAALSQVPSVVSYQSPTPLNQVPAATPNQAPLEKMTPAAGDASSQSATFQDQPVRLAGKVALPVARAYQQVPASYGNDELANVQNNSSSAHSDSDVDETLLQGLSEYERNYALNGNEERLWESTADDDQELIILGANANARGREQLAALKQKSNQNSANPEASNKLLAAFEAALKEVEYEKSANKSVTKASLDPIPKVSSHDYPKYGELPTQLQLQVPEFSVVAHVYSSVATNRWLNVDGVELQEGDKIQDKLTLVEIRPRDIILEIEGTQFKVPAI